MIAILSVYCKIGYIFSQLVLCMYVYNVFLGLMAMICGTSEQSTHALVY